MEFSLTTNLKIQTPNFSPMLSPNPTTKHALTQWAPPQPQPLKNNKTAVIKCGKNTNLAVELQRELEEIENQGRDWREMMKCKDSTTTTTTTTTTLEELLECLEREAIMGDNEGREPTDYNRRALIFDKSSKVFQALKQLRTTTDYNDNNNNSINTTES